MDGFADRLPYCFFEGISTACDSWYASEEGNREKALHHFNLAYEAYGHFVKSLAGLRKVVCSTGDTAVTDFNATA